MECRTASTKTRLKLPGGVLGDLALLMTPARVKNAVTSQNLPIVYTNHTFGIITEDIYPAGELLQSQSCC